MPFKRRVFSIESSPFALDKVSGFQGDNHCQSPNYRTFSQSAQNKSDTGIGIANSFSLLHVALQYAFHQKGSRWKNWTLFAGIGVMLILLRVGVRSVPLIHRDSFASDEQWDYNHYASETYVDGQRHLLMVQLSTTTTTALGVSRITSRPNRAYARQWGIDFHLTYDCYCPAQLLLDVYQMLWYEGEEEVPVYDAVLFFNFRLHRHGHGLRCFDLASRRQTRDGDKQRRKTPNDQSTACLVSHTCQAMVDILRRSASRHGGIRDLGLRHHPSIRGWIFRTTTCSILGSPHHTSNDC